MEAVALPENESNPDEQVSQKLLEAHPTNGARCHDNVPTRRKLRTLGHPFWAYFDLSFNSGLCSESATESAILSNRKNCCRRVPCHFTLITRPSALRYIILPQNFHFASHWMTRLQAQNCGVAIPQQLHPLSCSPSADLLPLKVATSTSWACI